MQAHLLYHTKMWCSCKVRLFLINLRRLNQCIKFLPHLDGDGLMTSKRLTLSDTQLCGIMMCRCQKEWVDQYDANIGGIATNVDTLLEHFETYKNLDSSKQALMSIPRKTAMGCSSGNGTKHPNSGGK